MFKSPDLVLSSSIQYNIIHFPRPQLHLRPDLRGPALPPELRPRPSLVRPAPGILPQREVGARDGRGRRLPGLGHGAGVDQGGHAVLLDDVAAGRVAGADDAAHGVERHRAAPPGRHTDADVRRNGGSDVESSGAPQETITVLLRATIKFDFITLCVWRLNSPFKETVLLLSSGIGKMFCIGSKQARHPKCVS